MHNVAQGLWAMEIGGPQGVMPGGVLLCRNGQVFGGDHRYFYAGQYNLDHNRFHAHIIVTHYQDLPEELFGADKNLPFVLNGYFSDATIDCEGTLPTRDSNGFMVRLIKLREVD